MFSYLADFTHLPDWLWKGRKVESISLGPGGAVIGFRVDRMGSFEVAEFIHNERLAWEHDAEPVGRERHFIELEPSNSGTRITYGYEWVRFVPFLLPWLLLYWLLNSNLSPLGRWYNARIMRRLQEQLESG